MSEETDYLENEIERLKDIINNTYQMLNSIAVVQMDFKDTMLRQKIDECMWMLEGEI